MKITLEYSNYLLIGFNNMIIAKTNLLKIYKISFLDSLRRFKCKKKFKKITLFIHFSEIYKYEIFYF